MKKNIFIFIIFTALLNVTGFSQARHEPPKDASLYVQVSDEDYDLGKIIYARPVSYRLTIKNISKDSLEFNNVLVSCGCTTPEWKQGKYAPNDTFSININFSGYEDGKFKKSITLLFNKDIVKIIRFHGEAVKQQNDNRTNSPSE
ncbi:MAG: DUF1573 domain-containing protein [Chitinophagaceae bacterium]|jgi:hypothetical protein|nr:DUF1573 domain-containing protein [Chitinophagaceae bacterium]